jgi:ubiquinone/menaquinone biosynthesis C-methylase UbiE
MPQLGQAAESQSRDEPRLSRFYGEMTSLDGIRRGIDKAGLDAGRLTAADLYTRGLDVHNLGGYAHLETIAAALDRVGAPGPEDRALDLGCGVGGPGRFLADRFGCPVVGIDLVPLRVETARAVAEMTGFGDRVEYRVADATALPFAGASFTLAWMLDASIHVRDKRRLFAEIARVLRPGGRLVLHDQMGPLPRAMLPAKRRAPWVAPPLTQFLRLVEDAGFRLLLWQDTTEAILKWFYKRREQRAAAEAAPAGGGRGRRRRQTVALLDGYIETLESPEGRTALLIARRSKSGAAERVEASCNRY